jgi:hypothetical protein
VRLGADELALMRKLIRAAEEVGNLAPGTITPATWAKSAIVAYMAQVSAEAAKDTGPRARRTIWDHLRENLDRAREEQESK